MKYKILKFDFNTAVHFGENNLSDTNNTFSSDVLFSAICVEKAKNGDDNLINELVEKIKKMNYYSLMHFHILKMNIFCQNQ